MSDLAIGAKERYLQLLRQRARLDHELSDAEEARHVDELDRYWWAMSQSERDEVELILREAR